MKKQLSPTTQAIIDAHRIYDTTPIGFDYERARRLGLAAAIRAAVKHVIPPCPGAGMGTGAYEEWMYADEIGQDLLTIASELQGES